MMKKDNIKSAIINMALGLGALSVMGCGGYSTVVKMPEIKEVPDGKYERIIKLNNPESFPDKTFAGLVFIKKGASVCTDYPREEIIKSLDDLTTMEKNSYRYFTNYEIKEDGKTYGFVSIPVEYIVVLWKDEENEQCKYKVQVEWINKDRGTIGTEIRREGPGGGHGGGHGH
ncbi:MAG: hypothetical protein LLG40_07040 [Deltaproteobacteria bacterium]|nr:hypothetical protein [Deltaproteobacteria bacterium]